MTTNVCALICASAFPAAALYAGGVPRFTLFPANTTGTAVSNSGRAAGASIANPAGSIVSYEPGVGFTNLGSPFGNNNSAALGINSAGVIVGQATGGFSSEGAFRYDPGVGFSSVVAGRSSAATDISDTGYVTGTTNNAAFLYAPGSGVTSFGGAQSVGLAVNNSGQVTGHALDGASVDQAFIYRPGGTVERLNVPSSLRSYGKDINDRGQVLVESTSFPSYTQTAYIYTPGQGYSQLPGTINLPVSVRGINNNGWVVGHLSSVPTLWIPGQSPIDLQQYINQELGLTWTLLDANDVNDSGLIVGTLLSPGSGIIYGYTLQVPAPTTAGTLMVAFAATAVRRRRRR